MTVPFWHVGLIPGPISHAQEQGPSALSPALIRATKAPQAFCRSPLSYSTDTATLPWNARRAPPAAGDGLVSQRQSHSVVVTKAQTDEGGMGCWPAQGAEGRSQGVVMHACMHAPGAIQDACLDLSSLEEWEMCKESLSWEMSLTSMFRSSIESLILSFCHSFACSIIHSCTTY